MLNQVLILVGLLILATVTLIPILWMVSSSLKAADKVFTDPVQWLPNGLHWENYVEALNSRPFFLYLMNSILASGVSVALTVLFSSAAGYSFSHFQFPGRDLLFVLVLSTLMIPFETIALPLYLQVHAWGWLDTYAGLIIPTSVSAMGVFIMRQYMLGIPRDMIESARIDGASEPRILLSVIWPLVTPALGAVAIFTFVLIWNTYLWPLLVITKDQLRTLPLGMALFENQLNVRYNRVMAVAVFGALPLVLMFIILQRNFVQGVAMTGMKEGE
jgi:ABC-type glycerol-3-phosphate transport system permease component